MTNLWITFSPTRTTSNQNRKTIFPRYARLPFAIPGSAPRCRVALRAHPCALKKQKGNACGEAQDFHDRLVSSRLYRETEAPASRYAPRYARRGTYPKRRRLRRGSKIREPPLETRAQTAGEAPGAAKTPRCHPEYPPPLTWLLGPLGSLQREGLGTYEAIPPRSSDPMRIHGLRKLRNVQND
jgi:hypothetical protein